MKHTLNCIVFVVVVVTAVRKPAGLVGLLPICVRPVTVELVTDVTGAVVVIVTDEVLVIILAAVLITVVLGMAVVIATCADDLAVYMVLSISWYIRVFKFCVKQCPSIIKN